MKKLALPLLALVGLLAPGPALATPQAALVSQTVAWLPTTTPQAMPVSCKDRLSDLVAKLQAPGMMDNVATDSTIIAGETAYAESCGTTEGYCMTGGSATYSGADIVGTSKVGTPVSTARSNLGFRITTIDGIAKLKWSFKGKSHTATVTSCSNGYWTAASGTSAVAIKLGPVQTTPE